MATTTVTPTGGIELAGAADVAFIPGGGKVDSDLIIEWDFDNDGDFDDPLEVITDYTMAAESLTGRDFPSSLTGKAGPGQLRLTLLNSDGRFSYFNQASPLNQAPLSLRTGRKIRVRTAESVPDDPVLLARDRFNRSDGVLGTTETGQVWTHQQGSFAVSGQVARASDDFATILVSTIDVGVTDYYLQSTLRQMQPASPRIKAAGLVACWTDINNFLYVHYQSEARNLRIWQWDGGVLAQLGSTYAVEAWEGMTIGVEVDGSTVTAYIGGAPVISATYGCPSSSEVGIFGYHEQYSGRRPEVGDFHVWDHLAGEVEGILWTGDVVSVEPSLDVADVPTVSVTAEGVLARAARAEIASPRLALAGAGTGLIVGDILARANLLHPPARIDEGSITTGPIGIPDGDALTMARLIEETERGFLHETNEGHAAYHAADARAAAASQAWFTDTATGPHGYSAISPLDHLGQIINRVTAGVAPDAPSGITATVATGGGNVDITMPTVDPGDLLLVFISSSTNASGERWLVPLWWVSHRDAGTATGLRVYSHWCDGTEDGTVVEFYDNAGGATGLFTAVIVRIQGWYQSPSGIAVGDAVSGFDPGALVQSWGRAPTLFLIAASAIGSATAINFSTDFDPPDGYGNGDGVIISTGTPATETGISVAWKVDCTDSEDPTPFLGLTGGLTNESILLAVRGYNGPHTKATLDNPNTVGGDGRFVTVEDVASQDEHNLIRTHRDASVLFSSEADAEAYGEGVLSEFADDRPIFELSFYATTSAANRAQAIRRRVGHKITVHASGVTGLGVEGDFFIEAIGHRWSNAAKLWVVTWQISPA